MATTRNALAWRYVPAIAGQGEGLALALTPLVEAAVAPICAKLAEVRALLSARDQELGHLRAQFGGAAGR